MGIQDYINVTEEKSMMSSDEDYSQQQNKAPQQVSKVSYTQSERMRALGAHLAYGKLHFFSELVLNEGSLGAVEHRIANDHLSGEELTAVKKFVKRQGRPNTGPLPRPQFNGTVPGQFQINKKKVHKIKSRVSEKIHSKVGMHE